MDFESKYNTKSPAVKRLMREALELREATDEYCARPLEDNLFEWHFTVQGPPSTEFDGGLYHGRILLPTDYPMKPPNIILLTPNGRFEVSKKICLSISEHHPETWQPSWSIRTALLALIAFMPTPGNGTIGSLDYTPEERKQLAQSSQFWECDVCGKMLYQLNRSSTSNAITPDESNLIKNVVFKGEESSESLSKGTEKQQNGAVGGSMGDDKSVGVESLSGASTIVMGAAEPNSQQNVTSSNSSPSTDVTGNVISQSPSNSSLESLSNVLIGLIVAAIAFLVYRRIFLI